MVEFVSGVQGAEPLMERKAVEKKKTNKNTPHVFGIRHLSPAGAWKGKIKNMGMPNKQKI